MYIAFMHNKRGDSVVSSNSVQKFVGWLTGLIRPDLFRDRRNWACESLDRQPQDIGGPVTRLPNLRFTFRQTSDIRIAFFSGRRSVPIPHRLHETYTSLWRVESSPASAKTVNTLPSAASRLLIVLKPFMQVDVSSRIRISETVIAISCWNE